MVLTGAAIFVACAFTTWLYSLLVHKNGAVSWDTAFFLALVCGIALPLSHTQLKKPKQSSTS
jgi:hypothetical protein